MNSLAITKISVFGFLSGILISNTSYGQNQTKDCRTVVSVNPALERLGPGASFPIGTYSAENNSNPALQRLGPGATSPIGQVAQGKDSSVVTQQAQQTGAVGEYKVSSFVKRPVPHIPPPSEMAEYLAVKTAGRPEAVVAMFDKANSQLQLLGASNFQYFKTYEYPEFETVGAGYFWSHFWYEVAPRSSVQSIVALLNTIPKSEMPASLVREVETYIGWLAKEQP